jgi:hypothetical protein
MFGHFAAGVGVGFVLIFLYMAAVKALSPLQEFPYHGF